MLGALFSWAYTSFSILVLDLEYYCSYNFLISMCMRLQTKRNTTLVSPLLSSHQPTVPVAHAK